MQPVQNLSSFLTTLNPNPDFVNVLKKLMKSLSAHSPVLKVHEPIGELILEHYSIHVQNVPFAFILKPVACHSYNVIKHENVNIKIGTIDTLFSYYLAFIYADRDYLDTKSILCASSTLFKLQEKRRLTLVIEV